MIDVNKIIQAKTPLLTKGAFQQKALFFASFNDANSFQPKYSNNDTINFQNKSFTIKRNGNMLQVISFAGKPELPSYAFKLKLANSVQCQKSINNLLKSNWQNDQPLDFKFKKLFDIQVIEVSHPEYGKLGNIPFKVVFELKPLIDKGHEFVAELSDIDGGTEPRSNISLRINVKYKLKQGESVKDIPAEVSDTINKLMKNPLTKRIVAKYQPTLNLEELLPVLLPDSAVNNIKHEIRNAQSILLVGHMLPDGDTIGSLLALRSALSHIGKEVDCSIDDDIDGYYRHKLPGIDENLKKPEQLDKKKKYDLVIVMDTPIPYRIGKNADFIKTAKQVIFIDHHPIMKKMWDKNKDLSGIDIDKIKEKGLLWVRPDILATCEMVATLIFKILPEDLINNLTPEQKEEIAKPLVAGMATDTEYFKKYDENKLESFAKYLMNWAGFSKKWIREKITYHLPKNAFDKMVKYSRQGMINEPASSYASITVPYDKFMDVFETAKKEDEDVILLDVINEFKFSRIFNSLRLNTKDHSDDKIVALVMQRKTKEQEGEDYVAINIRSGRKTEYARQIAEFFGGGGHPTMGAAQITDLTINDKAYEDSNNPQNKLTIERKIAQLADELRKKAAQTAVTFAGLFYKAS